MGKPIAVAPDLSGSIRQFGHVVDVSTKQAADELAAAKDLQAELQDGVTSLFKQLFTGKDMIEAHSEKRQCFFVPRVTRVESRVETSMNAHSSAKVSGWSFGLECSDFVLGVKGHKSSASMGIRGVCKKGVLFSVKSRCIFCGKDEETRIDDTILEQFALTKGAVGGHLIQAEEYDLAALVTKTRDQMKAEMLKK